MTQALYAHMNNKRKKKRTELNRTFSKEEIKMAKKHMKKCSPFLAIKENANQNHTKIPPYPCYHQNHHQQQVLVRM
jgi:hypothetical protein